MKTAVLTLLFWAFVFTLLNAQLGKTKTEIAGIHGWNFETGVTNDEYKVNYIYYDRTFENNNGQKYESRWVYYFNENGYCNQKKVLEPVSEINAWIKSFNSDYVRIDKMKWKDYSTGVVFTVEAGEIIVIITSFYEGDD